MRKDDAPFTSLRHADIPKCSAVRTNGEASRSCGHGQHVFVFGTLKKGFPLHERGLLGANFVGQYTTCERFPLVIAGPRFAPMMFNEPGVGFRVVGELYALGEQTLTDLDRLESVGLPGNMRVAIDVEPIGGGRSVSAHAYMKSRDLAQPMHSGYLKIYEDRRFSPRGGE